MILNPEGSSTKEVFRLLVNQRSGAFLILRGHLTFDHIMSLLKDY